MKIGIQVLAYNCHNTIEEVLNPWIKMKDRYDIKIWVGSGQFRIYKELGYQNKNSETLSVLNELLNKKEIDFIFTPNEENLLSDHETRNMCIEYFKNNDIDLMVVLDSDEFYTEQEVVNYLNFVEENDQFTLYKTVFKNLISDGSHYLDWERYSSAKIKSFGGISHYYFDGHWSFIGTDGNNVEYRQTPTTTVPKNLVNPIHDTWTNNRKGSGDDHIKSKVKYQEKYYSHQSGWKWNEESQTIEVNTIMWGDNLPEIKKL
jgi:hypothetical protein